MRPPASFSELVAALEATSSRAGLAMSRTDFLDLLWDEDTSVEEVLALEPFAMIDRGPRRIVIGHIRNELRYFLTLDADPRTPEHVHEMGVLHDGAAALELCVQFLCAGLAIEELGADRRVSSYSRG